MAKFPINLLLYLITLGLLGGSGFYFYEAVNLPRQPDHKKNRDLAKRAIERGKQRESVDPADNYNDGSWQSFAEANFTGKLPPKIDVEPVDQGPVATKVDATTPLEEIFTIQGIYYDATGSRVIISYKPSANVQPPADELKKRAAQQSNQNLPPGARGQRSNSTRAGRRGNRGVAASLPILNNPNAGMVHHLSLADADKNALWTPYQHIRLVSVSDDAAYAVFQRQQPDQEAKDWEAGIKVFKGVLDLDPDILKRLYEAQFGSSGGREVQRSRNASRANPGNTWLPTATTKFRGKGTWDIGQEEYARIREDPARVFNEDIGLRTYVGRGGRKGVQFNKISPRFQSFGFQVGDIIIALNDQPVTSKVQAINLGKKLYQRGVRTFRVKVLTERGYTEERVYNAPNQVP